MFFSNLGLDSILPHGEILLTLLLPLRPQRELYNKCNKSTNQKVQNSIIAILLQWCGITDKSVRISFQKEKKGPTIN
uniref:Uncharacterized protein n=1 Tax=Arundo donax TaxID=35708 RepID=A0A0A9CZK3_ARUDO